MLKYFLLLSILIASLFARNPAPYAQLGDEIYNSIPAYKKLAKSLPQMSNIINNYTHNATETKKLGFKAQKSKKLSKNYLISLRELNKKRDVILTKLNALLYRSMDLKDKKIFKKVVRSGFIDFDKVADDVIPFYKRNFKSGSIRELDLLVKNEKRYKSDAKKANKEYIKRLEERRIQRMREASKELDASREAKLDSEIDMKRKKINNMMETELIR
jgi:hypothetical protein